MKLKTDYENYPVRLHTNAEREKWRWDDFDDSILAYPIHQACGSNLPEPLDALIKSDGTPEEIEEYNKKHFEDTPERMRSFFLRKLCGYSPILFDLDRNSYGAVVFHISQGANDFNSEGLLFFGEPRTVNYEHIDFPLKYHSNTGYIDGPIDDKNDPFSVDRTALKLFIQKDEEAMARFRNEGRVLTPSMMIAKKFCYPLFKDNNNRQDPYYPFCSPNKLAQQLEEVLDMLFAYERLKKKGLDHLANAAYIRRLSQTGHFSKEQQEAEKIQEAFKTMDALLEFPEEQRFDELLPLLDPNSPINSEKRGPLWGKARDEHNTKAKGLKYWQEMQEFKKDQGKKDTQEKNTSFSWWPFGSKKNNGQEA